jgi:hypothetical protein
MPLRTTDRLPPAQPSGAGPVLEARQRAGLDVLSGLAGVPLAGPASATASRPRARTRAWSAKWLAAVLAVQAVLSLRLVWSNTAFQNEALYLWAGRLEISHWLHGTPIPPFAASFSGAPVLYPPLGALADNIGGLAAARILSLAFMLGTTSLLWGTTMRLYGRRAAFFAVALFAFLGPTIRLGAFATFDAPAQFLITLAAWCVVRAGARGDKTAWMLAAAAALALANATAYSSAIFDPVVIVLAIAVCTPDPGGKRAIRRGAGLFGYLTAAVVILVTIGGGYYLTGIAQATVARAAGDDSPLAVIEAAARWTGPVVALAALGIVLCCAGQSDRRRALLPVVLAGAALLVPLEQARLHSLVSLDKHVDIGAWFAAAAAGHTADLLITGLPYRTLRVTAAGACALMLAFACRIGMAQASALYSWPNAAGFVTTFAPLASGTGRLLVEDPSVPEYYLPSGAQWSRWSNTRGILLPSGRSASASAGGTGAPAAYARFIARGYFSVVALNFAATPGLDRQIAADLGRNRSYRVIAMIPYGAGQYTVWRYEPGKTAA